MNGVAQIAALVGALAYLAAAPVCMSKLIAIAALSTAGALTGLGGTAEAAGAASATRHHQGFATTYTSPSNRKARRWAARSSEPYPPDQGAASPAEPGPRTVPASNLHESLCGAGGALGG